MIGTLSCFRPGVETVPHLCLTAGSEFLVPVRGFFCLLCKEFYGDGICAEEHVITHAHNENYKVRVNAVIRPATTRVGPIGSSTRPSTSSIPSTGPSSRPSIGRILIGQCKLAETRFGPREYEPCRCSLDCWRCCRSTEIFFIGSVSIWDYPF